MRKILVVGATSAIAQACIRELCNEAEHIFLCARQPARLAAVADDLRVRSAAKVHIRQMDVLDYAQHATVLDEADVAMHGLDLALIAHGELPDQREAERSPQTACQAVEVNLTGAISLLTQIANRFEASGGGTIVVISLVAGDRGRRSNYVYGAAKGALSIFCDGLRHRFAQTQVNVLTVKPGLVDTPMTAAFDKGPLWASAEEVGRTIGRAIRERPRGVLYVPWFWGPIMCVIRVLPDFILHRMRL